MQAPQAQKRVVYLISPGERLTPEQLLDALQHVLRELGEYVVAFQLREQSLDTRSRPLTDEQVLTLVSELIPLCEAHGVRFVLNSELDVAKKAEVKHLHLGARHGNPVVDFSFGYSAHSLEEALSAEAAGADYLFFSPIFAPLSKPSARPALGLEALNRVCSQVSIPVYALGGIKPEHVSQCLAQGASGVACISSVLGAADALRAAKEFRMVLES